MRTDWVPVAPSLMEISPELLRLARSCFADTLPILMSPELLLRKSILVASILSSSTSPELLLATARRSPRQAATVISPLLEVRRASRAGTVSVPRIFSFVRIHDPEAMEMISSPSRMVVSIKGNMLSSASSRISGVSPKRISRVPAIAKRTALTAWSGRVSDTRFPDSITSWLPQVKPCSEMTQPKNRSGKSNTEAYNNDFMSAVLSEIFGMSWFWTVGAEYHCTNGVVESFHLG